MDKRFEFDTSSAHGLFHVALQAIRLGDMYKLVQNLDRFSRRGYVYNSLITSHEPNHFIYNLDASLSLPRVILEMLVYTEPGKIELLPAWPKNYANGQLKGVRVYGGHELDICWKEGLLEEAILYANQDGVYDIFYLGKKIRLYLTKGVSYSLTSSTFK